MSPAIVQYFLPPSRANRQNDRNFAACDGTLMSEPGESSLTLRQELLDMMTASLAPLPRPSSNRWPRLEARRRCVEAHRGSENQLCVPCVVIDGPSYRAKLAPRPASPEATMP